MVISSSDKDLRNTEEPLLAYQFSSNIAKTEMYHVSTFMVSVCDLGCKEIKNYFGR